VNDAVTLKVAIRNKDNEEGIKKERSKLPHLSLSFK